MQQGGNISSNDECEVIHNTVKVGRERDNKILTNQCWTLEVHSCSSESFFSFTERDQRFGEMTEGVLASSDKGHNAEESNSGLGGLEGMRWLPELCYRGL